MRIKAFLGALELAIRLRNELVKGIAVNLRATNVVFITPRATLVRYMTWLFPRQLLSCLVGVLRQGTNQSRRDGDDNEKLHPEVKRESKA